jgi:hypothetical protein
LRYPTDPSTQATEPLILVQTELCSRIRTLSLNGLLYFLIFVDYFYRYIYFLQKKFDGLTYFTKYKSFSWEPNIKKIAFLRLDNGGEFTSNFFNKFCADNNI